MTLSSKSQPTVSDKWNNNYFMCQIFLMKMDSEWLIRSRVKHKLSDGGTGCSEVFKGSSRGNSTTVLPSSSFSNAFHLSLFASLFWGYYHKYVIMRNRVMQSLCWNEARLSSASHLEERHSLTIVSARPVFKSNLLHRRSRGKGEKFTGPPGMPVWIPSWWTTVFTWRKACQISFCCRNPNYFSEIELFSFDLRKSIHLFEWSKFVHLNGQSSFTHSFNFVEV